MGKMVLDDLLKAIHNSVLKTQQLTEEQYFRVLQRYFHYNEEDRDNPDKWGSPKMLPIKMPVVGKVVKKEKGKVVKNEEGKDVEEEKIVYETVDIPAIALVPPSGIKIKKMKVKFEASLNGFKYDDDKKVKGFNIHGFLKDKDEEIDENEGLHSGPVTLKMGRNLFGGTKAQIEIEFESTDQPETVARINDKIVSKMPF